MGNPFETFGDKICDNSGPICDKKLVVGIVAVVLVLVILVLVYFAFIRKKDTMAVRRSSLGGNFLTGGNMPLGTRSLRTDTGSDNRQYEGYWAQEDGLYPSKKENLTGWREGPVFNAPVDAPEVAAEGFAGSSATFNNEDELASMLRY